MFGHGEEETVIAPAIKIARGQGIDVKGPLSPDAAFGLLIALSAHQDGETLEAA